MITEFNSPEQVIQVWKEANEKKKEAEEQIKLCKMGVLTHNVAVDTPLFEGYGIVEKTRRTFKVPFNVLLQYAENPNDFIKVEKGKFESYIQNKIEQGLTTNEVFDEIKLQYEFEGETTHYEITKLT